MIKKKVLIVAPYPITNPQHGGQKRVGALASLYRTIFAEVKTVSVFHRGQYEEKAPDDIWLGDPDIIAELDRTYYAAELIQGQAISEDIHVRSYFAKLLMEYLPDIIQIEQGYLYSGIKILLKELDINPILIFSSHNIEHKMKGQILKNLDIPKTTATKLIKDIRNLEEEFSKDADLVITVSRHDAEMHRSMGAKKCIVASNGISKAEPTEKSISKWQAFKKTQKIDQAILFVASAHPPNWVGFLEMVGDDTSFLDGSGAHIIIVGGVADYFQQEFGSHKGKSAHKFWKNATPLGKLSEEDLQGVLAVADIMLLPITSGGGSNLKTAEAILSRKKIVATPYSFRSFESHASLPTVTIAKTKKDFQEAIVQAVESAPIELSKAQAETTKEVLWDSTLRPLRHALIRLYMLKELSARFRSFMPKRSGH